METHYDNITIIRIKFVYIVAIMFLCILILELKLYDNKISWFFLVPFSFLTISFLNAANITKKVEDEMFKATFLSISLILALALFTWMNNNFAGDKRKFSIILITAIILSLLTVIDVWVSEEWLPVYRHIRSAIETIAVCLLIYDTLLYITSNKISI
jgi:hypothetical protein